MAQRQGRLDSSLAPGVEVDKPDFVVKCCLTFWYLLGEGDEWPLAAEFSFDYDLPKADAEHSDRLERFAPETVVGSSVLFPVPAKAGGLVGQRKYDQDRLCLR